MASSSSFDPSRFDPSRRFAVWPPPKVADIDPLTFGIMPDRAETNERGLNPYIPRDVDDEIVRSLVSHHSVVLSTPDGSGAVRSVYEALNRVVPDAQVLIPRRPEEVDAAELRRIDISGGMVLWIDDIGTHWNAGGGARVISALESWLADDAGWLAAICYDGSPDLLSSNDFRALKIPVVRLEARLTDAELAAMTAIYGQITTRSHIGYNPPGPGVEARSPEEVDLLAFSRSVQDIAMGLGLDAPVTASRIAFGLRQQHPEYAGHRLGFVVLDPDAGPSRPVFRWLAAVRGSYDPAELAASGHRIDGRLTLRALAGFDADLERALGDDVLADLAAERSVAPVRVPMLEDVLAPPQSPRSPGRREHVRWLVDEPVGLDGDRLGRAGVARALMKQLTELARNYPGRSFLVHIDGAWGTGKSTLLRFLREFVERENRGWLVVEYDAWRQSRAGPPWLTLLSAMRTAVRTTQRGPLRRLGFWLAERARLLRPWHWGAAAFLLAGVVAAGVAMFFLGHRVTGVSDKTVNLLGTLVTLGTAWSVAAAALGRFIALDSRRAARTFTETRADPMEDLAGHFAWMLRRAGRPVLLLVDDLDRCPEGFVVELLDAVQKLMRDCDSTGPVPSLMIVVAADGRWIRQSYHAAYASMAPMVSEPGTTIGSVFLEKLFQLTVPVPRLSAELKAGFLADLLADTPGPAASAAGGVPDAQLSRRLRDARREDVLDVLADASPVDRVRASWDAIDRLVVEPGAQEATGHALEPYAPLLDPTPRGMKRFVMTYSMLRAVRIAEGSVVPLEPLALWTILWIRWPLLAEYLRERPDAVQLFHLPADQLPATLSPELHRLFADPPAGLRAVMNHQDGPLTAQTIRECCGEPGQPPA